MRLNNNKFQKETNQKPKFRSHKYLFDIKVSCVIICVHIQTQYKTNLPPHEYSISNLFQKSYTV